MLGKMAKVSTGCVQLMNSNEAKMMKVYPSKTRDPVGELMK